MSQPSVKKYYHLLGILLGALIITGCTRTEDPDRDAREYPATQVEPEGIDISQLREVTIQATDDMRFSPTRFEVYPGQPVKVILKNIGKMPKETMGHNWLLISNQGNPRLVASSALVSPENDYIPENAQEVLIAYSSVLGPGEEEVIEFTAPEIPGNYDYICTFPGHFAAGMKGVMEVLTVAEAGMDARVGVLEEEERVEREAQREREQAEEDSEDNQSDGDEEANTEPAPAGHNHGH